MKLNFHPVKAIKHFVSERQQLATTAIAITKIFRRAGLTDCELHTLRHTLASKMVKNGFSLYEVQSILGHTSPTTTTRYSHLESASVSKKVAEKLFAK